MEIRVLGPVEAWSGGQQILLSRRQQKLILGILALQANRVVTVDRLVDLLWGNAPPRQARAVVQTRISELRAAFAADQQSQAQLVTRSAGYMLTVAPELVDCQRFGQLVSRARDASDEDARGLLREALGLWRGPVLDGWLPEDSRPSLAQSLESARLTALEDLVEIELRLGNHRQVIDQILELTAESPTRERLTEQLVRALHRAGRTAEAMFAYDRYRRWLSAELGLDPGPQLQGLYLTILRGNPGPDAGRNPGAPTSDGGPASGRALPRQDVADFRVAVPRLLPNDISDFSGRDDEVKLLCELLGATKSGAVAVAAVAGRAGVGKTSLCIHVAHRLRATFSDGQLFASLHGVGQDARPTAHEVLGRFLRALGVGAIPETTDERIDLYRDLLAVKKVLIVLDNVADADQVVPLIPAGQGCAVLINSRGRVGAAFGAETIELNVLDPRRAASLLGRIAGGSRIDAEQDAVADLTELAGYLPLAIRVIAARLATKPHWSVRKLANRLADERTRLDNLAWEHLDVRASIALSYAGLSADAKLLLRRLGDIGLPEVNTWTSAALLDTATADAEEVLEQLHDAQLVDVVGLDPTGYARYRMHDLVRLFAKERASSDEAPQDMAAALARAFAAWLFFAEAVHRKVYGGDYMTIHSPGARWAVEEHLVELLVADPLRWFEAERQSIVAVIRRSAAEGYSNVCWGVACVTSSLFQMRYHYDDWADALDAAYAAADAAGDDLGRAAVLHRLGVLSADRRDLRQAADRLELAATLLQSIGNDYGHAVVLVHIAMVDRLRGELDGALQGYAQALPGLRGDHGGEAFALRSIGQIHLERGDFADSDRYLAKALETARLRRSPRSEAQAMFWQGMLRLKQNRYKEAESLFDVVLGLVRSIGDRPGEAQALRGLGLCHRARGDRYRAELALSAALHLLRQPRPTSIESDIRRDLDDLARSHDIEAAQPN